MYTLNYVFDSELKADSPLESAGILEFRLIPADSLDSARIPGGISGGMKSIAIPHSSVALTVRELRTLEKLSKFDVLGGRIILPVLEILVLALGKDTPLP